MHQQHDSLKGQEIIDNLKRLGINTPTTELVNVDDNIKMGAIEKAYTEVLTTLGYDLTDDSLAETPRRVAKLMVKEANSGLKAENFPKCTTVENKFSHGDEFVLVKNIEVYSTCEHHQITMDLKCSIAYVPNKKVLGLSKFARIARILGRQMVIQERLTQQIAETIALICETDDVVVHMNGTHYCMKARGVMDSSSTTTTLTAKGIFGEPNSQLRKEFLSSIG